MSKRVVVIGPCPDKRGGMSSVMATYRSHGLFDGERCTFFATATEGGRWYKAWIAGYALLRFFLLLSLNRVSLLHAHGASFGSFWRKRTFIQLASWKGVPVVYHLHSGGFRNYFENSLSERGRARFVGMLRGCRQIYCLNRDAKSWLDSLVRGAAPVSVFPNPIEIFALRKLTPPVLSFLFLGRLEREKGVFELVSAVAPLCKIHPDLELVLCGYGPAEHELKALVSDLGIEGNVVFPGWVDANEKMTRLERATAFVLPSYAEGLPMSVLEAMVAGVPVVASSVGGIPEMLEQGKCGYLVPPRDVACLSQALEEVLDSPEALVRAARAACRVRSEYAADVVVNRLRDEYDRIVGDGSRRTTDLGSPRIEP